jgi:endonuclease YncB( thermonuclease family)
MNAFEEVAVAIGRTSGLGIPWLIISVLAGPVAIAAPSVQAEDLLMKVIEVPQGDLLTARLSGRFVKLRLYGIDCPEPKQRYGREARRAVAGLVYGREVVARPKGKDESGRLLVEILFEGGRNLNHLLVQEGLAWLVTSTRPSPALVEIQERAQLEKRGLWQDPAPVPPWQWRASHPVKKKARAR